MAKAQGIKSKRSAKMKAVLCPVCNGSGEKRVYPLKASSAYFPSTVRCNGCEGKGWVEVAEDIQTWEAHQTSPK